MEPHDHGKRTITVVIIEDEDQLRIRWEQFFNNTQGYSCVGHFGNYEEALLELPSLSPNVILMDIEIPGFISGIDAIPKVRELLPNAQLIMVTVHSDDRSVFESLKAGATGYLVKNAGRNEILQAIRIVVNGGAPMSMKIADMVLRFFKEKQEIIKLLQERGKPVSPLTERQMDVLHGLCHGQTYEAIAWDLCIHKDTVGEHAKKIYKRLQAINVAEAAYRAGQLSIIKSDV